MLFATQILSAQDVIVKKDNSTILSKVLEISDIEIKYKKWNNQDGPIYTIKKTDVVSINYQNGDIDKFDNEEISTPATVHITPKSQNKGGYMKRAGNSLYLNGLKLSDEEVKYLVGNANYETYISAKSQINFGEVCDVVFWISLGGFALCLTSESNDYIYVATLLGVVSDISLACSFIFKGIGKGRMNWVAEEYNKKSNNSYSFNIAPSIMNFSTPQSQNNYGLGVTLSLNF